VEEKLSGRSAGIGIQVALESGSVKVLEVFDNSPAQKAGVRPGDTITNIDNEPLSGLGAEKVIGKMRGPVNTVVNLTILRNGQSDPVNLAVMRGSIQMQSTQSGTPK